jgi:DNA-directed RNA polymerase specialized sigma24 family protein
MSSTGSVTNWISKLKEEDQAAAQELWKRYFQRLVGLARKKLELNSVPRREADEDDVALSAFASFCRGVKRGRFPRLHDRDNLWQLLFTITECKAFDMMKRAFGPKQGRGKVRGDSVFRRRGSSPEAPAGFGKIKSNEPTPAFAAQVADQLRHLFGLLGDEELRLVAQWKLEGYTNPDIAAKLGCVNRTVERQLRLIRRIWEKEIIP